MRWLRFVATKWIWLAPFWGLATTYGSDLIGTSPTTTPAQTTSAVKPKEEGSCGKFGTQVNFVETPSEAARQALKEQKLVFVLHVSGHFEDPRLT
jgi:hypothetical protein